MPDWTSTQYIISQILISAAYIFIAASYFMTSRFKILLAIIASNLMMGIGFGLLAGWVGVMMCAIAICRDVTSAVIDIVRTPNGCIKNTAFDWCLLAVWTSAFTVAAIMTQEGFMSLFAYFSTMTFTVSIWQKNPFIYRVLGVFSTVFWVIYNIAVASVMGAILETILLFFVIGGLVAYWRDMRTKAVRTNVTEVKAGIF
ncbi:MAG: YgjV family protein [Lactobacillales bacterium]|jgi:hypothetical protein|nr:YgjV family protein [Lactobacillales bacterium]